MIKEFLKRFLPLPARTTNGRFDEVIARLDYISSRIDLASRRIDEIVERQKGIEITTRNMETNLNHVAQNAADMRTTQLNTEVRFDNINGRITDVENRLIWTKDMLGCFAGHWQAEAVSRRGGLEGYPPFEQIKSIQRAMAPMMLSDESYGFCRMGSPGDGGYVMLDDFSGTKIAYSFGVGDEISWDKDMASRGFDIYMYDHTIDALPEENEKFHWKKTGIAGIYSEARPELETLPRLLAANGHDGETNMILKIDVEGAEWEVLNNITPDVLNRFSQIVFELHELNSPSRGGEILSALKNLRQTHAPVHLHANNCEGYRMYDGLVMPDALECTFLNISKYRLKESDAAFPTGIDVPNTDMWPEIMLGAWRRNSEGTE